MVLDAPDGEPPQPLRVSRGAAIYASLLAGAVVLGGVLWGPLTRASERGVNAFKPDTTPPIFRDKKK
jgi:hypothetical protein